MTLSLFFGLEKLALSAGESGGRRGRSDRPPRKSPIVSNEPGQGVPVHVLSRQPLLYDHAERRWRLGWEDKWLMCPSRR